MKPLTSVFSEKLRSRAQRLAVLGVMVLANGACASPPVSEPGSEHPQIPQPEIQEPAPQADVIELRANELPNVALSADLLYRLLVADFAIQYGAFVPAADTTLDVAKQTMDPRLAERAVELYMLVNHYVGALDAVNVWLRAQPDNQEARSMRLALMAALGQTEGLEDALVQHVKENPDKTQGLSQIMGILGRMEDREQAYDTMQVVIERSGQEGSLVGFMALADMADAAQDAPRAYEHARSALKKAPDNEDAAMRVLDYGYFVDPDDALTRAKRFAGQYPDSRRLRMMLVSRMAESGQIDDAVAELKTMSRQFPEDFDLLFVRGQFAFQIERYDDANRLLEEFVEVQTQRRNSMAEGSNDTIEALADAYTLMAAIAERQGDPDRAIELLGKIEEQGALYSVRLRQAKIRADQGRVDEALQMIDAAHPVDQDEELLGVLTVSQILRQAQRYDDAIERLTAADKQFRDSVEIKYELAMLLEAQDEIVSMERYLRQVIELDPGYAHAFNALGYSLANRDMRLDEAYELISTAHQLAPQDPFILDSLGWVRYRQGDLSQAHKFLEQAYEIRPEAEIAAHLGEVLWEMSREDEAREIWKEGMKLNPENAVLQETVERYTGGQ